MTSVAIRFLLPTRTPFSRTGGAFALIIFTRAIYREVNDPSVHLGVGQLDQLTRKGISEGRSEREELSLRVPRSTAVL